MKRLLKRYFTFFLPLLLTGFLAGCSGNNQVEGQGDETIVPEEFDESEQENSNTENTQQTGELHSSSHDAKTVTFGKDSTVEHDQAIRPITRDRRSEMD